MAKEQKGKFRGEVRRKANAKGVRSGARSRLQAAANEEVGNDVRSKVDRGYTLLVWFALTCKQMKEKSGRMMVHFSR